MSPERTPPCLAMAGPTASGKTAAALAMAARWPVESVRLVHRLGPVLAGEASLWVEVVAPHRGEAFAACQWLIDEMKRVVPIWKRTIS